MSSEISKPEERSTDEEKFQREFERFFSRVGYAITRWAHIDRTLFEFCRFALRTSDKMTAVVFYRSPNIKDHFILTNTLMRLVLSKPHIKRWDVINKKVDDLLPFRNDLAHNPPAQVVHIVGVSGEPKFQVPPTEQWWEIRTEETKLLHKKRKPMRAKQEHIVAHIQAVDQLLGEILAFQAILPMRSKTRRSSKRSPD